MDRPKHVVGPRQGISGDIHIDLFVTVHEQLGSFVKVFLFGRMFSDIGKGFFDGFPKVFDPRHEVQQLRDGQVGQLVPFGTSNLIENLFGTNVGDAGTPQGFQGPVGGETWRHLVLDKDNFRCQVVANTQDGSKDRIVGILFFLGLVFGLINTHRSQHKHKNRKKT
jgi:hypothetical protein